MIPPMRTILKTARYKWYDPAIDPPVPRSRQERRRISGGTVGGTVIGGALGAMGGGLLAWNQAKRTGTLNLSRVMGGASLGAATGGVGGRLLANRSVYKDRIQAGEPLNTPVEEAHKLNLSPTSPVTQNMR